MYKIKLEKFEGPLDLLLQLIESADLDITEVALSKVTDQYMQYLEQVEKKQPEELADFLVVASKLLLIKSKALLPNLDFEDEDVAEDLETQLKIYKEFYEASKKIEEMIAQKRYMFVRQKIAVDVDVIFNPPKKADKNYLRDIFKEIIKDIEPIVKLPKKSMLRAISIKQKIVNIQDEISKKIKLNFSELLAGANDKTELVVTFLSVLELVKQRTVVVRQEEMFSEIVVEKCS